jgi:FkbM family methyltransferase
MNILDVGANIGYFTLMFADAVGRAGHVWAFEPTPDYQERIADHLARNGLGDRVTLLPVGLSDRRQTCPISVGPCSATLHPVSADDTHAVRQVQLQPLDDLAQHLQLPRIDLIKIDIDGHEPAMLRGGEQLIRRDRPAIIIEFAQANLFSAGSDVLRLQAQLHDLGYQLHNEDTRAPYPSQHAFLQACGNYTHSANVWAFPAEAPAALAA